jgi:hypothetical protein
MYLKFTELTIQTGLAYITADNIFTQIYLLMICNIIVFNTLYKQAI